MGKDTEMAETGRMTVTAMGCPTVMTVRRITLIADKA
jgi:hypothetical protein